MANCCPYCGSRNVFVQEKGYSVGKGVLGVITFGLIGGLAGLHGSKRLVWRCANCQRQFNEPATAAEFVAEPQPTQEELQARAQARIQQVLAEEQAKAEAEKLKQLRTPPVVKQRMVCNCGAYNSIYNKTCFSCGEEISLSKCASVPTMPNRGIVCQCGVKNSLSNKHCTACGQWLDYSQLEQQNGQPNYNSQQCTSCGQETPAKSRKVLYCAHCGQLL